MTGFMGTHIIYIIIYISQYFRGRRIIILPIALIWLWPDLWPVASVLDLPLKIFHLSSQKQKHYLPRLAFAICSKCIYFLFYLCVFISTLSLELWTYSKLMLETYSSWPFRWGWRGGSLVWKVSSMDSFKELFYFKTPQAEVFCIQNNLTS